MSLSNIRVLSLSRTRVSEPSPAPGQEVRDGLMRMLRRNQGGVLPADVELLSRIWPDAPGPTPEALRTALDEMKAAGTVEQLVLGSAWHIRLVEPPRTDVSRTPTKAETRGADVLQLAKVVEFKRINSSAPPSGHPESVRAQYEADTMLRVWADALPDSDEELDRAFDGILSVAEAHSQLPPSTYSSFVPNAREAELSRRNITPLALPAVVEPPEEAQEEAPEPQRLTLTSAPTSAAPLPSVAAAVHVPVSVAGPAQSLPFSGVSAPVIAESTVAALAAALSAVAPMVASQQGTAPVSQVGEEERSQFEVDVELDVAHERVLLYRVVVVLELIVALVMARQALLMWLQL